VNYFNHGVVLTATRF